MKNIHYYFIIAILSFIIGLLNIDDQSSKDIYDVRLDEGYISSSKTLSSNTSVGNNVPMNSVFPTSSKSVGTPIHVHPVLKQDEYMSAAFEYSLGDARLIGEAGCMRADVALSINPIESNQLPPLNQGMVNVTGDNTGYRMLPKGMVFKNDIDIILPYDTTLLPIGFTPNDIKTYYYDERFKRWIEIERDSVDETNQLVISKVNHFTDFINAVLKTPEMPETSAYAPTQMNDIKAANPLEGMTLMQPPTANNNGTVSMSYPIEIPAGRQGMQPNLALSYNGGTSSSWLGVGWDISIPSITIETRWGVPRYDQTYESELYLYNGEQLVTKNAQGEFDKMPHRTNQWKQRYLNPYETQFYPRVNETFDSIVRHGYSPADYWWSVTDRNGITNYYGKMHDSDNIDTNAILTDENGNIAHWALTETRDVFGNTVRYYYSIDQSTGLYYQDVSVGKQIYIDSINYTGFVADTGYTRGVNTIVFKKVFDRPDATISANLGFKRVDNAKLCNIHIVYNGPYVDSLHDNTSSQVTGGLITRSYHFLYKNSYSSNFKTVLIDIIEKDMKANADCIDNSIDLDFWIKPDGIRTHFDYFEYPNSDTLFSDPVTVACENDNINSFFLMDPSNTTGAKNSTALGSTRGKSWSIGGTGTVGVGPNVFLSGASVGGNFDYSRSSSEGAITMIDLDGDGLTDKVFKDGDYIYYRKQLTDNYGNISFGNRVLIEGANRFMYESGDNISWGLQASFGCSFSGSWPSSESYTSVYFTDVNADGLPDIVTDDGVLFNSIVNGVPHFSNTLLEQYNNSNISEPTVVNTGALGPCGGIIFDGEVDDGIACEITYKLDTILRFWANLDTVLMNNAINDFILTRANYGYHTFENYMHDDDRYHVYIFKKIISCEPKPRDPDLDVVRVWVAPRAGTIQIISDINLIDYSSDNSRTQSKYVNGVRYSIEVCNNLGTLNNYYLNPPVPNTLLGSLSIDENDYSHKRDTFNIPVSANSILFFRLQSQGNRDFDYVNWNKDIQYIGSGALGNPIDDHFNSSNDFVITGLHYFSAFKNGYLNYSLAVKTDTLYEKSIDLIILRNNIISETIPLSNHQDTTYMLSTPLSTSDNIKIYIDGNASKNHPVWSNIVVKPQFGYDISDPEYPDRVTYYPPVNFLKLNEIGTNRLDTVFYGLFGPLYRGWGQFCYRNDSTATLQELIDVSDLKREMSFFKPNDAQACTTAVNGVPTGTYDPEVVEGSYASQGIYYPTALNTKWVNMNPSSQHQSWIGYGNINLISKEKMTNTRHFELYTNSNTEDIPDFDHPVPIELDPTIGSKTIRKLNKSYPQSYSFNGSPVPIISVGTSYSKSSSKIVTDYMDLNGDRYPDFIGEVKVQYSKPWGGIGELQDFEIVSEGISVNSSESIGISFGGSYPVTSRGKSNNPRNAKMSAEGSGSPGFNIGTSNDQSSFNFMDVNGDGLPDKVLNNGLVAINLGYKFLPFDNWNFDFIRNGKSINGGVSNGVSFNAGQASISGGSSISYSENTTEKMLMDFNGDGLQDIVSKNGNYIKVNYNLGNGTYSSSVNYDIGINNGVNTISELSYGTSFNESMNLGVNFGFTWGFAKFGVGVTGSPLNKSFSKDKVQWVDINGDGAVDYVTSDEEGTMVVRYNNAKKVNMLKKVTNFSGSTVELNYSMPNSSFESPQRSWVLDTVKTYDPYSPVGGNATLTTFEYQHPNYNRFERTGYGYDTVITRIYSDGTTNNLYKVIVQGYNNSSYLKKGKKISESIFDGNMNPYIESLYEVAIVDQNGTIIEDDGCPKMAFPVRTCEITNYFEGQTQVVITTKKCVVYDSKRNIVAYTNEVDSLDYISDDDITALITYKQGMPNNMLSLVENIQVYDAGNNLIRERSATYDNNGKMLSLSLNNWGTFIQSDFEYDMYGNMTKMTLPENLHQQRLFYEYEYDPVLNALPTKVTSALGYVSRAEYDYVWQKPLSTFDINGQEMRYEYDIRGRNIKITGPNEIASGAPYTIRMEYHPVNVGRWDIMNPSTDTFSFARTFHYDVQNPNDPIQTTLLADGLGRVIQTKKDIEENGVQRMQVSGRVVYDAFGRVLEQYLPEVEVLNRDSIYNYTFTANTKTSTKYDIMDRETEITIPGNIKTYMNYSIEYDYIYSYLRFLTITTDPLGNRTKTFTDPRKLQTAIVVDSTKITQFFYNAIGELIQTYDPDNHLTEYGYSMLGQKYYRTHPDAGNDQFIYDYAGNLIQRITQDLANNQMVINYDYNYNQMISIQYPKNPEHNVNYYYGDNSASNNRKGRVYAIEDASGRQEFSYGRMGEVVKNIRTFVLPNELNTYTFKMEFRYDSWNRILTTCYPDGEKVSYNYNKGGQLKNMNSNYNGQTYNYINSINYNKFEKRTLIIYGNGARAEYSYDILQRLTRLKSISNSGIMQDIEYKFDNVNNIRFIRNTANTLSNGLGGTYSHEYSYDNMYRLKNSDGNWQGLTYQLNMTYSDDGRILSKNQTGTTLLYGQLSYFSYQNNYTYNVFKHTLDNITDTNDVQNFEYDANGNLIHHEINTQNLTNDRTLCWDEENRLMSVIDNNFTSYYVYDNANERTFKLTGTNSLMNINGNWMNYALLTNPTLYTSAYLVANNQGYSKHYYAGSERIATSIGKGGLEGISTPLVLKTFHGYWKDKATALNKVMDRTLRGCGGIQYSCKGDLSHLYDLEHNSPNPMELYFYHSDHLGSSSWITDRNGQAIQHLHYLPYGEDWIAQRNTSWTTPYTFSGKEKDVETGYGYFGARYYDSGLSIWLSVDPMSDKYPSMSPYNYCANNPVILVDPDGRDFILLIAPAGAGGNGHMAAVIQDGDGNWYYATMGAAEQGDVSKMATEGVAGRMVLTPIGTKNKDEAIAFAKNDKNNSTYTETLEFQTSSETDSRIYQAAVEKKSSINSGKEAYKLTSNNCADVIKDIVETGTGVNLPSKIDPRPKSYFNELKKQQNTIQVDIKSMETVRSYYKQQYEKIKNKKP